MQRKIRPMSQSNKEKNDDDVVAQSPVAIYTSESQEWTPKSPLIYDGHWHSIGTASITNNGITALMTFVDRIDRPLLYGGPLNHNFVFEQMHFHWSDDNTTGSEHSIDGKKYAAEAHLVHYNSKYGGFERASTEKDGLAVTAFMLNVVPTSNTSFNPLSQAISDISEKNQKCDLPTECLSWMLNVNLNEYFTYPGSLTTEPFLESVTWIVYKKPIDISNEQMEMIRGMKIYKDGINIQCNAREIQRQPHGLTIRHVKPNCFKDYRKTLNIKSKL